MALPPDLQALAARVSNWGRWGPDDERGTLNLIDAAAVRRGVAAATVGKVFSLAMPFGPDGPQDGGIPGRDNPVVRNTMANVSFTGDTDDVCFNDDRFEMGSQAATHWDALSHVSYGGLLYNGVDAGAVTEAGGVSRLGIDRFGPVVSRGVLCDVARLHGVEAFDDGHPISGDELDACAVAAGLTVQPGDIICVRTGQFRWLRPDLDKLRFRYPTPGLGVTSLEWLHDNDVAAVASDTFVLECFPGEDPAVMLPVHMINLRDIGLVQGQLWWLDDLAADCADDGRYEFLLAATPLPLAGAAGGPVAPTAVK
jgi:kynurenine formamidase